MEKKYSIDKGDLLPGEIEFNKDFDEVYKKVNGKFKPGWKWEDTLCQGCAFFDGYDICLAKGNFGTVMEDKLNNCLDKKLYKAKYK